MNTLVSIIIPVYNREKTLQRLFQSLVLQDYRPLEVILVDNASTDASLEICNEFKSGHSSSDFDIICVSEERRGASAARNKGLNVSKGKYVSFFDSDDEMSSNFISEMAGKLDRNMTADIVVSKALMVFEDGRVKRRVGWENATVAEHILASIISTQSFVCRRDFIKKIGGWNESLSIWVDYELGIRILLKSENIIWYNKYFHKIHQHSESLTGDSFSSHSNAIFNSLEAIRTLVENDSPECNLQTNMNALYFRTKIIAGQFIKEGDLDSAKYIERFAESFNVTKLKKLKGRFLTWYQKNFGYGVWLLAIKLL